jgi:hypothetical protein
MTVSSQRAASLAVALSAFAAAGCNNSVDLNGPHNELAADIGTTARDEVESAVSALTLGSSLAPFGTSQPPAEGAGSIPACVTPSSAADSDGDGVPDDATYIFTAPPCEFPGWRGGSLDIVGQLRVQDPLPSNAGFGYEATLTDLRSRFASADNSTIYDVIRNGRRTLSGSTTGLLLTADLQVRRNFTGHPDATVDKQWAVNYTPATPLQINGPLPSGSLDIAGTADWNRGNEHFEFTITTPTPLQYDAGCTDTAQRIRAGELHAAGTIEGDAGFVRVRWTECGREPQFSFETTQ